MTQSNSFEMVANSANVFTNRMPKRDSHTHRILCKVLGKEVVDDSSPELDKLPSDVLAKMQEVIGQNRDLKENLPQIEIDHANLKAAVRQQAEAIGELKEMFGSLLIQLGGGKREAPASASEQPKAAKKPGKKKADLEDDSQADDLDDGTGLPPAEK